MNKRNHHFSSIYNPKKPNLHTLKIMRELSTFILKLIKSTKKAPLSFGLDLDSGQSMLGQLHCFVQNCEQRYILMFGKSPFFKVDNKPTLKTRLRRRWKDTQFPQEDHHSIPRFLRADNGILQTNCKVQICRPMSFVIWKGNYAWWRKKHWSIHFMARQNKA